MDSVVDMVEGRVVADSMVVEGSKDCIPMTLV